MPTTTLNIGILAHVDAGKTSLTERLLFDNGSISELGSVDAGSTQTDTGELERERGITIRSAVAAFTTGDLQVNLVDTPGHPDFIAEVERALSVLDGAVLVLSAVEGVQAQTRVLMRSLRTMRLPTLIFVNKIDRAGARYDNLLDDIRRRLAPQIVAMDAVRDLGTRAARPVPVATARFRADAAEVLAEHDDALLAQYVAGSVPRLDAIERRLAEQTAGGVLHPVFFGSALTGAGSARLVEGIRDLLNPPRADPGGDHGAAAARGTVFAIERAAGGEKVAYLRLFSGELHERQRIRVHRREPDGATSHYAARITGLEVVAAAAGTPGRRRLTGGDIGKLRGLPQVRVGDRIGEGGGDAGPLPRFASPSLETIVRPRQPGEQVRLHSALASLADEDPLIRTRAAGNGVTSVLLYGAVQREVIAARLERDFGVAAVFERPRPVYFERPAGTGAHLWEFDRHGANDFWATIGLRIEPAAAGSGVRFVRDVEWGSLPRAYHRAIEDAAQRALEQGLYGWQVTDCAVTLFRVGYEAPVSETADFRNLTPIVLMRALREAGTRVYEPCHSLEVEVPAAAFGSVLGFLNGLGADISRSVERGPAWLVTGELPARLISELTTALPGLTQGEGVVWSHPGTDRPVRRTYPTRDRLDGNPLNYEEYLRFLADRRLVTARGPG